MGYPMTWPRLMDRNGLRGEYGVEHDGVRLVWDSDTKRHVREDNGRPGSTTRGIAGDARRLEHDTLDEMHLTMYAKVAGVSKVKVRRLFEAFFTDSVMTEFQKTLAPEEWAPFWRKFNS